MNLPLRQKTVHCAFITRLPKLNESQLLKIGTQRFGWTSYDLTLSFTNQQSIIVCTLLGIKIETYN